MFSATRRKRLLLSMSLMLGCAVAETQDPADVGPSKSGGGSGGKASSAAGGMAQAGSGKAGSAGASRAGAAGSDDAGSGGDAGGNTGGTKQGGSGGASAGVAGAAAGAAGAGPAIGTVLFMDDFETGEADGWLANTTGDWAVVLDGANHIYRQPTNTDVLHVSWVSGAWKNLSLQAKVKILAFGGTNDQDIVCLYARVVDDRNHYSAVVRPNGRVAIRKRVDGTNTTIGSSEDAAMVVGTWYTMKLEVAGSTLRAYVDGTLVNTQTDTSLSAGGIGLGGDNSSAEFDDVLVTAL